MRLMVLVCVLVLIVAVASPFLLRQLASNGPTVTVSVQASDPNGLPLHYKWKSTDGTITNVDAASTTWILPPGPGIHFAYVLVFNNHGGYTERRVAVNTDTIGTPPVIPPPTNWAAPASSAQVGDYYRSWAINGAALPTNSVQDQPAYVPNAQVFVKDTVTGTRYPASGVILASPRGEYVIPGLPAGHTFQANCSFNGGSSFINCTQGNNAFNNPNFFTMPSSPATAWSDYNTNNYPSGVQPFNSFLTLSDGSTPCGTSNEFFNVHSTGSVLLRDASNRTLASETIPENGAWALPFNSAAASVEMICESATPIVAAVSPSNPNANYLLAQQYTISNVSAPVVSNMSATLNGSAVGTFLPPPTGFPSDVSPFSDAFLEEKGLDSQVSACQYYKTIGAVQACDSSGNPSGAISFEDWKREVKIDKYATTTEYSATYINKADLNLTRNHHSVTYGPNETAGYVCNYVGYKFNNNNEFLVPTQAEVDTAVGNAAAGHDLVACVAMDWGVTTGVNGNLPFTRFLIFGPSGQLLPSVNLDGRREKYVPGTCVVCHGGDHYAGHFPTDGTGKANIGAHFLPYDEANFLYSSTPGLRQADQETQIYDLNQTVLNTGPTVQEHELINGWYASGQTQNTNFIASSWASQGTAAVNFYQYVHARSCRGCHIVQVESYDWDHFSQVNDGYDYPFAVCAVGPGWRGYSMPNSLVTMNRFWLSSGNTVGLPDQLAYWKQFAYGGCSLH